jgi:CubicO group peptidase (beta-lactamase class C family)
LFLLALLLVACRPTVPSQPSATPVEAVAPAAPASYWPAQEWRTAAPEEQGLDSNKMAAALFAMREQEIDIHSLLILRNGSVLVDAYFYPYDGTTVHEVASVTKSIMTTLIGIAADQGKLSLDDPMLSFFPERTVANRDARKEAITVRHLATMTSGLDCTAEADEQTLQEMRVTDDWVQFALDRPVRWEPDEQFVYCSPAIHLLSPILERATDMPALDFARRYLFEPLGIEDVLWLTDPQGFNRGSEGIYLHPHDMARLGYLWLNGGVWNGKQIVSSQWVHDSVQALKVTSEDEAYGYGWWVDTDSDGYNAIGRGGQRISVLPAAGIIVVTTGGGFDIDEIEPLLLSTVADLEKPLPANPTGIKALAAAVAAVAQPPAAQTQPLPPIAQTISNMTFAFPPNPLEIETAGLDFANAGPDVANWRVKFAGQEEQTWPVGLDGVLRMSAGRLDLPQGLRGHWEDDETFLLEYDNIANNDHVFLRLHFAEDSVTVEAQETAHEGGTRVEGKAQ